MMKTKARFKGRTRQFICVNVITLPVLVKILSPSAGRKKSYNILFSM